LESYFLPWFFGSEMTKTDHWEKRKQKGILITIGDEHCHKNITPKDLINIFTSSESELLKSEARSINVSEIYEKCSKKYEIFHLNLSRDKDIRDSWNKLIGERSLLIEESEITDKIIQVIKSVVNLPTSDVKDTPSVEKKNNDSLPEIKITL
jgi:hypothetical protein